MLQHRRLAVCLQPQLCASKQQAHCLQTSESAKAKVFEAVIPNMHRCTFKGTVHLKK